MNYIYILECEDGSYYTGWTNDLEKRYQAHVKGKGARYTRAHKPVRIAYAEMFDDRIDAMKRKYAIKQMSRRQKEDLMKGFEIGSLRYHNEDSNHIRRLSMSLKVVKCMQCGKIAVILKDSACPTKCCGEAMVELVANSEDAAGEKHVPVVTRDDESKITVSVGSIEHPMSEEHYIEWIALETANGFRIAYLNPGDKPCAAFYAEEPVIAVYAYCNLHGLWKTEA